MAVSMYDRRCANVSADYDYRLVRGGIAATAMPLSECENVARILVPGKVAALALH
jgi:hypothetical protein